MSDAMGTLNQKIDSLVFDCFQKSSDIILQGRRCTLEPEIVLSGLQPGIQTFKDNSDYCCQVLRDWRVNLNSPLVLDVSLLDLDSKEFHLMERWKIIYKRKDDTKDGRLSSVSRRIITLMRTLYCFVRLLPGFQLLNMCPKTPLVTFRLYNPEHPSSRNFVSESSYYDFPRIQTFRGTLYLGVRYMAANVLQKLLQIPPGLLSAPSETPSSHLRPGRGGLGSIRSTVPIPIPGMGLGSQQPVLHSSSEKSQSRSSMSSTGGIASYPASADRGSMEGISVGGRSKDVHSAKSEKHSEEDQASHKRDVASTHSRSLDSRPQELHHRGLGSNMYLEGRSPQLRHPRFEDEGSSGLLSHQLVSTPKHSVKSPHVASNGRPNPVQQQDQINRHSQGSAAGSLVSESGMSPGGGTPFYLNGAVVYPLTSTLGVPRDVGREGRARSVSAFTGLTISETEGDGVTGNGGSGLSPPYLEFSTQLMSTSPQAGTSIGKVGMARLDRSQGALTLYQMPSQRSIVAEDRARSSDSALHQNQLAFNLRNTQNQGFAVAADDISLSLHMALPRSPFELAAISYSDTTGPSASEMVLRPRCQNHPPAIWKSPYGSAGDSRNTSDDAVMGQERDRVGHGARSRIIGVEGRRTSFTFIEDDERDNDEDENNQDEPDDDGEDMPFAWADQSTILNQNFDNEIKVGSDGFAADGDEGLDSSPVGKSSISQRGGVGGAACSYSMPPALVSFPDAPWCESGTVAVAAAIFNQLNEYKEFRSTFPT